MSKPTDVPAATAAAGFKGLPDNVIVKQVEGLVAEGKLKF